MGAGGRRRTSSTCCSRSCTTSRSAPTSSSSSGSLPRGVDADFYGELIRELNRRQVLTVLDAEGEPLRLGLEAEPFLVSPNQREAEALVGQEFYEHQDFALRPRAHRRARGAQRADHEREPAASRACAKGARRAATAVLAPQVEPVSRVGSGDVLLAGFVAAVLDKRSTEDALRSAVAAGAASTLEVGAGRFDPRVASRARRRTFELDRFRGRHLRPIICSSWKGWS